MPEPKFELGCIFATAGVAHLMNSDPDFAKGVDAVLARHHSGDWGDMDEEDVATNNYAVLHGQRLMSDYEVNGTRVWIITEWDRSVTTVLFPEEY